jgi:serine/threonine protein phosphatase PrpC
MTIQLKPIIIDAASRPLMPARAQAKKIIYSEALSKGYVPSVALQSFGAPPSRVKSDGLLPINATAPRKTHKRLWQLGLMACLLLVAGIAMAEPWQRLNPASAIPVAPSASLQLQGEHMLSATPSSVTPKMTATAPSESTMLAMMTGTVLASGLAGGLAGALVVSKTGRRRSVPLPEKVTDSPTEPTAVPEKPVVEPASPGDAEEEPVVNAPPALFGLDYVEPQVMLASMKRAYPKRRIEPASGSFAVSSVTGHNTENQDYGLAFDFTSAALGPIQVAIISDGCGGHFGGRSASYTSVSACVEHLLQSKERKLIDAARGCLEAASQHVASVGTQMWGHNEFRCTLIVLLANQSEYALAYIGDGGADVRRADGTWECLLTPQKDEKTGWLTGSLGPSPYGNYVLKTLDRKPGDFLVAGTDGIYVDEVNDREGFWAWPRQMALKCASPSDLGSVLDMYVSRCLEDHPEIFDDNVTALVLTTPQAQRPMLEVATSHRVSKHLNHAKTTFYENVAAMGG